MATRTKPIIICVAVLITVLQADSPAIPVVSATPDPQCLHIKCDAFPTCEPHDPLEKCATEVVYRMKPCSHPYNITGQTLYRGYLKVMQEYCNKDQPEALKKNMDILKDVKCWNDSLFCIAKPLGIDSGIKLPATTCNKAWERLQDCWNEVPWACRQPVKRISPLLYNTIEQCGGVKVDATGATTPTAGYGVWHFLLAALLAMVCTE